jgi:hypothetical protein
LRQEHNLIFKQGTVIQHRFSLFSIRPPPRGTPRQPHMSAFILTQSPRITRIIWEKSQTPPRKHFPNDPLRYTFCHACTLPADFVAL